MMSNHGVKSDKGGWKNEEQVGDMGNHDSEGMEEEEDLTEDDEEGEDMDVDTPVGFIRMRPSGFRNIPPSVFFEYPKELNMLRKDVSSLEKIGKKSLNYSCQWGRNCIRNAFKRAGFKDSQRNWTAMWSKHQAQETIRNMNCLQKVNHFPASWCIGRKDRLMRTIHGMKRLFPEEFNFHPEGYILPSESLNLERALKSDAHRNRNKIGNPKQFWIVKPYASSCGKGIRVINHEKALQLCKENKKLIVQRYLSDPYLINNKKFDLRMYVLVTGADPLRVYVHDEGLTRLSTKDYSLKNIKDRFAHLTNYSINKKASNFVAADEGKCNLGEKHSVENGISQNISNNGEREGFKWSLPAFKRWLAEEESEAKMEKTIEKINDLIVKTIIAAEPDLSHSLHSSVNYRTNCFELFGFDIFLDSKLDPHLIEVNISPSLMGSSELDKRIKGTVISDVCHVVGFHPFDNSQLARYNRIDAKTPGPAASSSQFKKDSLDLNPFSFTSISKLMSGQDAWRKDMTMRKLNMNLLKEDDAAWILILMIEDEFKRGDSSRFHRIHPQPKTVEKYLSLYKNQRFSDNLLGKWTAGGLSSGRENSKIIPQRFLRSGDCKKEFCERVVDIQSPRGSAMAVARSKQKMKAICSRSSTSRSIGVDSPDKAANVTSHMDETALPSSRPVSGCLIRRSNTGNIRTCALRNSNLVEDAMNQDETTRNTIRNSPVLSDDKSDCGTMASTSALRSHIRRPSGRSRSQPPPRTSKSKNSASVRKRPDKMSKKPIARTKSKAKSSEVSRGKKNNDLPLNARNEGAVALGMTSRDELSDETKHSTVMVMGREVDYGRCQKLSSPRKIKLSENREQEILHETRPSRPQVHAQKVQQSQVI